MEATKTFVVLDLETTGLPRGVLNPCKITEIALVAASREHILDRHLGVSKENNFGNTLIPRVLNKMNCAIYPCKMIDPMASEVSGLINEDLEHQKPFDEKLFEIINQFMERLQKPICLVAHNGNKFDFPLLQAELLKIKKNFPEHVSCADSLPGFREVLDGQSAEHHRSSNVLLGIKPLNGEGIVDPCKSLPKCGWSNDAYDNELAQAVDLAEKIAGDEKSFDVDEIERKISMEMGRIQKMNEQTPGRRIGKQISDHSRNERGVMNPIRNITDKEASVRRKLMKETPQPKRKYNLSSLYNSLTKKDFVNAHQAEADALALLECLTAVGRPILEWIDNNKIPFRSVKRMW